MEPSQPAAPAPLAPVARSRALWNRPEPLLVLAPMQDITDLAFWRLMQRYGGPDVYFTEYFRVHSTSNLEKWILQSIADNDTGRPVVAQLIGNDIPALVRAARELQHYPVAGIDLNLGCPAPVVYRKCAGGGLLRDPERIDRILGALRDAVHIHFSVKTRLGFASTAEFESLLPIFGKHALDLLTVHGRTVAEMYRSDVHYDCIAHAVRALPYPIVANGNVSSAAKARQVLERTNSHGLMIGRGAIRNPWMFTQIRQTLANQPVDLPRGRDVLSYLHDLYTAVSPANIREEAHVQKLKKYMNFIGLGVEPSGGFLHAIRRVTSAQAFFALCQQHLDHNEPMPLEPFALPLPEHDLLAGHHG